MKIVFNALTSKFDMVNDEGVAPVNPSAVGNLVSFADIVGGQADSGIAGAAIKHLQNITVTYDGNGHILTVARAGGSTTTFTWSGDVLVSWTDGVHVWTVGYDIDGNIETITVTEV